MARPAKQRKADYLLIDVSNSFTKIGFASEKRLREVDRFPTAALTAARLARILRGREVRRVVVSSVVPEKNRAIQNAVPRGAGILWITSRIKLGISIDYPQPRSIGADRLANAAAVVSLYGAPAIVVDFGTAVTFDIVSRKGSYIGGVIAPGLEAMTNYLHQRTALLPKISLKEPASPVGKTTVGAMRAGAVIGYRGLVREILQEIRRDRFARSPVSVIATGGYARLIAGRLPEIDSVHPNLTLEGLRIIGNLNSSKSRA